MEDPANELAARYFWLYQRVHAVESQVEADRLVEPAAMLPPVEFVGQEIRQLARAFSEGLIEGAGTAVMVLEVTRDVAFAVAASVGWSPRRLSASAATASSMWDALVARTIGAVTGFF